MKKYTYGLANLSYYVGSSAINTYVIYFYTDVLKASVQTVSLAWLLFGIWNTINDPFFGWLSDRIAKTHGSRTLLISLFSVPLGIAFFAIWSPPRSVLMSGNNAIFWYLLLTLSVYDLLQTGTNISQASAFPELTTDPTERTTIAAVRQALGIIGVALGVALSPVLFSSKGWATLGIVWGVVISTTCLVSLLGFSKPRQGGELDEQHVSWRDQLLLLITNRTLLLFMGANFFIRFALGVVMAALPFYVRYSLNLPPATLSVILGAFLASAILVTPLWPRISKRVDASKLPTYIIVYLIILLPGFWIVKSLISTIILALFIGPAYGGLMVILDLLFAKLVDADTETNGYSRAGIFSGLTSTGLRMAPGVAGLAVTTVLSLAGYDISQGVQPTSVLLALKWAITFIPGLALIATIILFYLDMVTIRNVNRSNADQGPNNYHSDVTRPQDKHR